MDTLLMLIKSLSKSEKSHFRKLASRHLSKREAKKVILFDLINQQAMGIIKDYHEKALEALPPSSLPSLKTRLYNQILDSLVNGSSKSRRSEVSQMIDEVEVLIDRGLLKQALSRIDKARKIAEEQHFHSFFLEISLLHRRIISQYNTINIENLISKEHEECSERVEWIAEEFELLRSYELYYVHLRKEKSERLEDEQPKLQVLSKWNPEKIDSFEGKVYYHSLQYLYHVSQGSFSNAFGESQKLLSLFEDAPLLLSEKLPRYLRLVTNHLNICFRTGRLEEAVDKIEEMRQIRPQTFYAEAQMEGMLLSTEVILYYMQRRYDKVSALSTNARKVFDKYQVFIPFERIVSTCYNLGVTHYMLGNLNDSLEWLNACLEERDFSELKEKVAGKHVGILSQGQAIIFRLIVFYEMGNLRLVTGFLPRAFYYFEKNGLLDLVLFKFLGLFRVFILNQEERKENLQSMRGLLSGHPEYEEYDYWVKNALQRLSG